MGAIRGKDNIIALVRLQGCKHLKICLNENQRLGGNYIWSTEYKDDDAGIEDVCDALRSCLDKLTPGRYYLTGQKTLSAKKDNVVTPIEIEDGNGSVAAIGSTHGYVKPLFLGGTEVTAENLNDVINDQFKKMQAELKRAQDEENLKRENAELKKLLQEKESGINAGLQSIGAIVLPILKKTPAGKQLLATVAGLGLGGSSTPSTPAPAAQPTTIGEVEQEEASNRIAAALEKLNTSNALQLADELELLAKVKTESPETFNMGLDYLKGMSDE